MMSDVEQFGDLNEMDLSDWAIIRDVAQSLREARAGDFVPESILDILDQD